MNMNDGGPAFPLPIGAERKGESVDGMSLRDYFAATANMVCDTEGNIFGFDYHWLESMFGKIPETDAEALGWYIRVEASLRYMKADAMLAVRNPGTTLKQVLEGLGVKQTSHCSCK